MLQPYMQYINDDHNSTFLPESLIGDEMRLKQVMATLIKNALKYSKGSPVDIYSAYDRNSQRLQVKVVD